MTDLDADARAADAEPKASRPLARPQPKRSGSSFTGRAIVLVLVAVTLMITLAVPVRAWFAQRAEIAGLRSDVDAARDRVAALQIEQQRWDDPAFVAAEARRRLHFVLPGEVGFVTLGSEAAVTAAAAESGPRDPWYSSLWQSLREADGRAAAPTG